MTHIRYGAKQRAAQPGDRGDQRPRSGPQAVTALWETDPELIAAVLPPPLEPGPEPLVRLTITTVEMPGLPAFGAGWFGVQARHGDRVGEYPLFMPMTHRAVGDRRPRAPTASPRRSARCGPAATATRSRPASPGWASPSARSAGRVTEAREPYEKREDRLLVQVVAVGRAARRARPGPAARLRREDREGPGARDDRRRRSIAEGLAARPHRRPRHPSHGRPQLDGAGDDPGRPDHRPGARAPTSCPYLHQRYDDLSVLGEGRR